MCSIISLFTEIYLTKLIKIMNLLYFYVKNKEKYTLLENYLACSDFQIGFY